ncbi:MAG TPA: VOC family protein [Candidatus Paceibacterota bacterium]|jgi:predicted enzyme related to lactoylglutathione lyase|nr:VOC family protein [Candidatus Paceibacterota bacterium]
MNNIAYFEIQASEPAKLAEFYKTAFGWEFKRDELVPIEYYRTQGGSGIFGAILKRPTETPAIGTGTNAYVCSVQVENFDETAKKILDQGGIVAMEKFAVPGRCWQGYFLDIDHNTFGIFQADENAK